MISERWAHGEKAGKLPTFLEALHHLVQINVRQAIAVVGKEDLLVLHMFAHGPETLSDIPPDPGIDHRHAPVFLRLAEQLHTAAVTGHDAVRKGLRPIPEEEILNDVSFVAEAQHEVVVPELPIVLHHVPEYWLMPDGNHRLGNAFGIFADPGPQPATKQNDLHG